jgi:hypothetical protein
MDDLGISGSALHEMLLPPDIDEEVNICNIFYFY